MASLEWLYLTMVRPPRTPTRRRPPTTSSMTTSRGAKSTELGRTESKGVWHERAAKRAAARVDAAQKKRKALPPPPMYQVPVDKKPKVAKKPPPRDGRSRSRLRTARYLTCCG